MKDKKRYITALLLALCAIILAVPVLPHHHHAGGTLCLQDDIAPSCCSGHNAQGEHCCCNTGCVTTHFHPQDPATDAPGLPPVEQAAVPEWLTVASAPAPVPDGGRNLQPVFRERLHGTCIARAAGLRAPPVFFFG